MRLSSLRTSSRRLCQFCLRARCCNGARSSSESPFVRNTQRKPWESKALSQFSSQQFQRVIEDRLNKECAVRVAQDESLMFQSSGERTAHEVRSEAISKSISEVEHKSREDLKSETGDAVNGQSKVSESKFGTCVTPCQIAFVKNVRRERNDFSEIRDPGICRFGRSSDADPADRDRTGCSAPGGCVERLIKHRMTLDSLRMEADQAQTFNIRRQLEEWRVQRWTLTRRMRQGSRSGVESR